VEKPKREPLKVNLAPREALRRAMQVKPPPDWKAALPKGNAAHSKRKP
jgi:hypothetical protein